MKLEKLLSLLPCCSIMYYIYDMCIIYILIYIYVCMYIYIYVYIYIHYTVASCDQNLGAMTSRTWVHEPFRWQRVWGKKTLAVPVMKKTTTFQKRFRSIGISTRGSFNLFPKDQSRGINNTIHQALYVGLRFKQLGKLLAFQRSLSQMGPHGWITHTRWLPVWV